MQSSAIRFSADLPRNTALNIHGSDQAFTVSGITDYHFLLLNCSQTGTLHRIKNRKCIKSLISSAQNTKPHMHPSDNERFFLTTSQWKQGMTSVAKSIQDILIFDDFPYNHQTSAENN